MALDASTNSLRQLLVPNCTRVASAPSLRAGRHQDPPRVSTDWKRLAGVARGLAQSKTLTMKMPAVTAVQDDASVAAGLLSRVDLTEDPCQIGKMVRL